MVKRTTITDISKALGISPTTVTRALNKKPKVSEELRKEIIETAERMGYKPNKTAQALVRNAITIGMVYFKEPSEYFGYVEKGLIKGINDLMDFKVTGLFKPIRELSSTEETRKALIELSEAKVDGIILCAGYGYKVYEDVVKAIDAKGIPVLYLTNDIHTAGGLGCVKLNGNAAGRMAAQMLGLNIKDERKSVVILTSNKEASIHQDCIEGFTEEAELERLNIRGIYETQDDKRIAYYLTEKAVSEVADLGGIYVSSYNSVSVCNYLEEHNLAEKIAVIGQDLYPELVAKLEKGSLRASLFQDPFGQGLMATKRLYRYITEGEQDGDVLMTPQLVLRSNLDCYRDKY